MIARMIGCVIVGVALCEVSLQTAGAQKDKKTEIPKNAIPGKVKTVDFKANTFTLTLTTGQDRTFGVDDKTEFWGPTSNDHSTGPKGLKDARMTKGYEVRVEPTNDGKIAMAVYLPFLKFAITEDKKGSIEPPKPGAKTSKDGPVKKDTPARDDMPKKGDEPKSAKVDGAERKDDALNKNPGVEVFYGTNRLPWEGSNVIQRMWREVFDEYFTTSMGWSVGVRLFLSCFIPVLLIFLYGVLGRRKRMALIAAIGLVTVWIIWGRWTRAEPWFLFVLAFASGIVYLGVSFYYKTTILWRMSPGWIKLLIVGGIWLLGWGVSWFAVAWLNANLRIGDEGPEAVYTSEFSKELEYGICRVSVPAHRQPGTISVPTGDIIRHTLDPEEHFYFLANPERFKLADSNFFFKKLQARVRDKDNPDEEAFIYIHGYNNRFSEVAFRAAALKTDLGFKGPAIMFSWPAKGYIEDYPADEEAVDYSQAFFETFLQDVTEHSGATRIYLIAHSMGNRALSRALINLHQSGRKTDAIQRVVFAAPDVNRQTFLLQLLPDLLKVRLRMTLYASDHDRALEASRLIHKISRAGLGGDEMVASSEPLLETIDVSPLRVDFFATGHDYAFSRKEVLEDLKAIWRRDPKEPSARNLSQAKTKENGMYWVANWNH